MFGRKKAPDTLPSLGLDGIRQQPLQQSSIPPLQEQQAQFTPLPTAQFKLEQKEQPKPQQLHAYPVHHTAHPVYRAPEQPAPPQHPQPMPEPSEPEPTEARTVLHRMKSTSPEEEEQGYFKELIKSVTEESGDVEKLSSWYENKFLPNDLVFQMREYWEKQQPELMLKNIRGDLKNELMEKTNKLHALESEWQDIYFKLLSKEDEIRKEERQLKDSLSEFMNAFKQSLKKRK